MLGVLGGITGRAGFQYQGGVDSGKGCMCS